MVEQKISKWVEDNEKRAKGQAGFIPKYSNLDHVVTLRHIIEKAWEEKTEIFCCFVDFRKAFDMVPREKLWCKMQELGIPLQFRATVHRLYVRVGIKIRTKTGTSESFRSDIGFKQGCPLSPTLLGLYIDQLEELLNMEGGEGIWLGEYVIRLLLYADDLILIATSAQGLQKQLLTLEAFCKKIGMQVNISKTKIMVFSNRRKRNQQPFFFEGSTLEEVTDYKYLGIDFNNKLSWETRRKKRMTGGWKALYALQNNCREAELWDWKTTKTLFETLVIPVVLYGVLLSPGVDMGWISLSNPKGVSNTWLRSLPLVPSPSFILNSHRNMVSVKRSKGIAVAKVLSFHGRNVVGGTTKVFASLTLGENLGSEISECHTREGKKLNSKQVRTLLIDNYDSYTYNIFQLLAVVNGVAPTVVKNDQITWEYLCYMLYEEHAFDNIVISPGPGSPTCAADIGICKRILCECKDIPILGVCLGHQVTTLRRRTTLLMRRSLRRHAPIFFSPSLSILRALGYVHGAQVVHAPEPVHGRLSISISGKQREEKGRGGSPNAVVEMFDSKAREEADDAIGKFFYVVGIPFNAARSPYYKEAMAKVAKTGTSYVPPGDTKLRTTILDRNYSKVNLLMEEMKVTWVSHGCSIIMDGWTDIRHRPLINIIVSCKDGPYFLRAIDCFGKRKRC
ncbi:hypothetical protein KI387_027351 [Taxus chinensis]|uniref:Reverse transcriptase domain-containing protein n=1 Tax=Taxus chinensis TaxID=29808 RepID=A0AA38FXH2_TAXCH|nr:hypothetical protein KI387_027351 [Taxus chinensis]